MMSKYFHIAVDCDDTPNFARVSPDEILSGKRIIHLGCNLDEGRLGWFTGWAHPWFYEKYPVPFYDDFIELRIEDSINHEVLHILCAQLEEEKKYLAGRGVDWADDQDKITGGG